MFALENAFAHSVFTPLILSENPVAGKKSGLSIWQPRVAKPWF